MSRLLLEYNPDRGVMTIRGALMLDTDVSQPDWEDLRGFAPGSILIDMGTLSADGVQIQVSNAGIRPGVSDDGIPLGDPINVSGPLNFDGRYRWIRAKLVNPISGIIGSVYLYAG